ncbi:HNH endonuclease [Christiangramia crocea]|uniref:Uncharacterized protein n=1 Tax=Christiangramia crocea TaxID=2904124 RepID=A0A9X1UVY6_9FLAO|nr:hypothetical protein [Gramella crocea]MCG9971166.1 hypothetical protein [Gramella crocea]
MKEYINLLETGEWKRKRLEILNRDNFTCQRCGFNKSNFKDSIVSFITGEYEIKVIKEALINHLELTIHQNQGIKIIAKSNKLIPDKSAFILVLNFIDKRFKNKEFKGSLIEDKYYGIDDYSPKINVENLLDKDIDKYTIDLNGVWIINPRNDTQGVIKEKEYLEIHHKCYRTNKEIWDQDDNEYITVCNVCHKIAHENYKIPYYDENNNILNNLIPCNRCYGKGSFPEFSHVNGGTCFRCYGSGHEIIQQ